MAPYRILHVDGPPGGLRWARMNAFHLRNTWVEFDDSMCRWFGQVRADGVCRAGGRGDGQAGAARLHTHRRRRVTGTALLSAPSSSSLFNQTPASRQHSSLLPPVLPTNLSFFLFLYQAFRPVASPRQSVRLGRIRGATKGLLGLSFRYHDVSLAFICAHLPSLSMYRDNGAKVERNKVNQALFA